VRPSKKRAFAAVKSLLVAGCNMTKPSPVIVTHDSQVVIGQIHRHKIQNVVFCVDKRDTFWGPSFDGQRELLGGKSVRLPIQQCPPRHSTHCIQYWCGIER
jgi:hypothetical protein